MWEDEKRPNKTSSLVLPAKCTGQGIKSVLIKYKEKKMYVEKQKRTLAKKQNMHCVVHTHSL